MYVYKMPTVAAILQREYSKSRCAVLTEIPSSLAMEEQLGYFPDWSNSSILSIRAWGGRESLAMGGIWRFNTHNRTTKTKWTLGSAQQRFASCDFQRYCRCP